MADREVRIRFTGDSAVLKGSAADVRKIFQNLIDDENDARGAGEKLADAQKQVADSMRQSMAEISVAADVLADSLGPEMVAAIQASGSTVEDQVVKFQKLGLTLDDIKMDSDQLAAGMKELDDAARMSTGSIGDGFKKVAAETDNSRSVMANFAGNAAQEIPMMGAAFGPLNMAIGQFTEYAAEGNIQMGNLAKLAGPMVGVAAAISYVNNQLELMKAKDAFREERVKSYREVLDQTGDSVANLAEHLREVGKIEATTWGNSANPFADATVDLTEKLIKAGLTVDQYARLIEGGTPKIAEWAAAQKEAGNAITDADLIVQLGEDAEDYAKALEAGATSAQFFARTQNDVNDALGDFLKQKDPIAQFPAEFKRMADALAGETAPALADVDRVAKGLNITTDAAIGLASDYADTLRADQAAALDAATAATEAAEQATRDFNSAQLAGIDAGYAVRDAQDQLTASLETLGVTVDDQATGVNELTQAQDDAAKAALALGQAAQTNAEQLAAAAGAPLTAAQSNQVLIDSLYATVLSLDEGSPVRAALVGHIKTLQGVPATKSTTITATGTEDAATRIGGVKRAIDDVKAETKTDSKADVATAIAAIDKLTVAIDGVPDGVTLQIGVPDVGPAIAELDRLARKLDEVQRKADKLEGTMNRVAG